jgi:hypothetical protein
LKSLQHTSTQQHTNTMLINASTHRHSKHQQINLHSYESRRLNLNPNTSTQHHINTQARQNSSTLPQMSICWSHSTQLEVVQKRISFNRALSIQKEISDIDAISFKETYLKLDVSRTWNKSLQNHAFENTT